MRKLLNRKGFTVVELMVVVVIIGILVAVAVPLYRGAQQRAREAAFDANVRTLRGAAELYLMDGGGDAIWAAEGGQEAGEVISGPHEAWYGLVEKWPENPLDTGDYVVEISDGRVQVWPGRE